MFFSFKFHPEFILKIGHLLIMYVFYLIFSCSTCCTHLISIWIFISKFVQLISKLVEILVASPIFFAIFDVVICAHILVDLLSELTSDCTLKDDPNLAKLEIF